MPALADFPALEALLAARVDFERTPPRAGFELERVRALAAALGEPGAAAPALHVAGTSGKGTLCALVACAASLAGLKVGWTTSPHLCDLRERIRIGALPASDATWCAALGEVLESEARLERGREATYFELVILSALTAFRREAVDLAVVETGLGGRLDATRVVHPSVSAITRIGRDHCALLGAEEGLIAAEKAGILVPGVPLVAGPVHPAARATIAARAAELGCEVWWEGEDLTVSPGQVSVRGRRLSYSSRAEETLRQNPVRRSALALAAGVLLRLEQALGRDDLVVALPDALERLTWRARCEWVEGHPPLLIDGAHDANAARALAAAWEARGLPPASLVFAVAQDKDLPGVLEALVPLAAEAWVCAVHAPGRACDPLRLVEALAERGVPARACSDAQSALTQAQAAGRPLLVAGSLHLAGAVLSALGQDAGPAWSEA